MLKKVYYLLMTYLFFISYAFGYQYDLSIGMIFKDEAPYLKEWIEYHRLVGVKHFCLFNNQSEDNYKEVLQPYIDKGIVDLFDAVNQNDFNGTQVDCYNRTLIQLYKKSKWVAMIDSDEFLITPEGITILDVLNQNQSFAGVMINWRSFGTSHVDKIPKGKLMIECLTYCALKGHYMNAIVKSIVRPEAVLSFGGPHWPEVVPGQLLVDPDGKLYVPGTSFSKMNKLWINHYWTRDNDFLINKKIPRSIPWGRDPQEILNTANELNSVEETSILRHVPSLKKKMFKKHRTKQKHTI